MAKITQKDREEARSILAECGIPIGEDYYVLSSDVVDRLLRHADAEGYEKPRNANGSRARYFHERLQRRAISGSPERQTCELPKVRCDNKHGGVCDDIGCYNG